MAQKKLTGPRTVICSEDPALDRRDPEKLAKALEHTNRTGEQNGLPILEGRSPVRWQIRSLPGRAYRQLTRTAAHYVRLALDNQQLQSAIVDRATFDECWDAFRRGVVAAEGATDDDGAPIALEFDETPAGRILTEESTEAIFRRYKAGVISELGWQVIRDCEVPSLSGSG